VGGAGGAGSGGEVTAPFYRSGPCYLGRAGTIGHVASAEHRLDLLKTLGDNTRYAIYLELARSPRPLATSEIADSLGLHPNTVRPHLERMRDVGLLEVRPDTRGAVGRPQKMYSLAADAPSLGLEPPVFPMLARMLLDLAGDAGVGGEPAAAAGRAQGRRLAHRRAASARPCVDLAIGMLDELGFDPAAVTDDGATTVAFGHCPFADLAESNPDLVCSLHRGLLEGFVDEVGGAHVDDFHDLADRSPCQVALVAD
jgi:predicted ArsR family transcriptional regulator